MSTKTKDFDRTLKELRSRRVTWRILLFVAVMQYVTIPSIDLSPLKRDLLSTSAVMILFGAPWLPHEGIAFSG